MSKRTPLTDELKRAIRESGLSRYEISKRTGVNEAVLSRFMAGKVNVNLATADALAESLGLRFVVDPPAENRKPSGKNTPARKATKRKT
jgi:transcriptional regulator with XRE-family HTH domain